MGSAWVRHDVRFGEGLRCQTPRLGVLNAFRKKRLRLGIHFWGQGCLTQSKIQDLEGSAWVRHDVMFGMMLGDTEPPG